MAGAVNPVTSPDISSYKPWNEVIEQLRRITVQIFAPAGGHGAGVIWSSDGLIVTNAHVTNKTSTVRLEDGRSCRAELISRDRKSDLCLLHIPLPGITSARLRDSRSLRAGEVVVAVGHPFGETGAVSFGIVHTACAGNLIEADIRLAPGNSGGPLADAAGRVVGVNCMVANGMGVAVSHAAIARFLQRSLHKAERA
jgi:serine protease Do